MNEYDGTNVNVLHLAMIDDWNYYVGYTVINEYNKLSLVPQVFTRIKSFWKWDESYAFVPWRKK